MAYYRRFRSGFTAGKSAAFTLIELLVVIAIIAILAAILFPVFAQARDKARQAACLSNTKQIALGINMYAQDYDEILPVAGYNAQFRGRWQWQVFPYVKNEQVFTCPNLSAFRWRATTSNVNGQRLGRNDKGGYGWNYALQGDASSSGNNLNIAPGYALARIAKPADTIIVGETGLPLNHNAASGWAMMACDPRSNLIVGFNQPGLFPQFRHHTTESRTVSAQGQSLSVPTKGQANFVFLDGHAKALQIGTAMQIAAVEDGKPLRTETVPNHTMNDVRYVLWNIY